MASSTIDGSPAPADTMISDHERALTAAIDTLTATVAAMNQSLQEMRMLDQARAREVEALKGKVDAQEAEINALRQSAVSPPASTAHKAPPAPTSIQNRSRNLVVCIDGTSNQFSVKNTNVVELYHRLVKDNDQLTFYNSGIGTYATPSWRSFKYYKKVLYNKIDLAIAWNFDQILLSAYKWLVENYEDGDVIYLFGFSRGAYQIRTLAAMIDSVGLLYKGNQDQIVFAYELYADTKGNNREKLSRNRVLKSKIGEDFASMRSTAASMCSHFKRTLCRKDVKVHFVGAWDTVSSVGLVRDKTFPGTTEGMKHVTYFRHALALHERRVKFLQENARGGAGPKAEDTRRKDGQPPHTKEVWFAGSHGDIGGGVKNNLNNDQFGPALRWMIFEATVAGLRFTDAPQKWEDKNPSIKNTLHGAWRVLEILPFTRLSYDDETSTIYRPHLGRPRKVNENQLIHETALKLMAHPQPHALHWCASLPGPLTWSKLKRKYVEPDPYTAAGRYVAEMTSTDFSHLSDNAVVGLRTLLSTDAGCASFRDIQDVKVIFYGALRRVLDKEDSIAPEDANPTIDVLLSVMEHLKLIRADLIMSDARKHAERIAGTDEDLAKRFMTLCGSAAVSEPLRHPEEVKCVAYLPKGDQIVTGCDDGIIRLWNLKTVKVVQLASHSDWVRSVAVSSNGERVVSGSDDRTIRVWNIVTGTEVALLEGHEGQVCSVAFSPDGTRVVSGGYDCAIRLWDIALSKTIVEIKGHAYPVRSVTFSRDGSRIISGSADDTIGAWDAHTGESIWRRDISSAVMSVSCSPDGSCIAAGCEDGSVRVVKTDTGETLLSPLTGHTSWALCVAFSPNGDRIVSGSVDFTVRLWDAKTGEPLDILRGHDGDIWSVIFSPDGRRIASASSDETVRIWDTTGEWKAVLVGHGS